MPDGRSTDATGVRAVREGDLGRIVLDRPRALNALDLPMVRRLREALAGWRSEPLRAVTIESGTAGVFCAGGDIRRIRQNTLEGDLPASDEFFATEYEVNEMLASYPVPVVALIDGVCMGGGMGLSVHGPFRVVTERAVMAMPETAIGFFPDIGASHFLSRLPGAVGTYLGLTGARMGPADALEAGLATHYVPSGDLDAVLGALADDRGPVEAVLRDLASSPAEPPGIGRRRGRIDSAFGATTVNGLFKRLDDDASDWARETRTTLEAMSPQSLELTLDLILWGGQRSLRECLDAEREAAAYVVRSPDFIEGVRAALVDKDRSPRWKASQYEGMSPEGAIRWAAR
ncbi:enoyl-CoA hydratase/isomerase family protein [Actinomadura welshii]